MNVYSAGWGSVYGRDYTFSGNAGDKKWIMLLARSAVKLPLTGQMLSFPQNTAILFDEKSSAQFGADDEILVCDWLCFDTEGDSEFIESLSLEPGKPVRFSDWEFISQLIRNIQEEFYSLNSRRIKMMENLLKTLLIKLSDAGMPGDNSTQAIDPHYTSLAELREKIYRNPQMKWNVDTMAAYVNMSRSYFQHLYREVFGVSCMTDVISGKIEKAKEILSETSCTVSQVSAMCGYDNEEHFMRQFKKLVGMTPTAYRKKN